MTLASPKFQHAPLDHGTDAIRLIQVVPAKSGPVQCTMHHAKIHNSKYTCLSYEWGAEELRGGLILMNGKLHYVRRNLLRFLQRARRHRQTTNLWIDALSIDQGNNAERAHQVHLMGQIYRQAVEVWAWLGHDSLCAELFARIEDFQGTQRFRTDAEYRNRVETYQTHIRAHRYWKRAWITQEIILARKIWLLAEDNQVDELDMIHSLIDIPALRQARREAASMPLLVLLGMFCGRQSTVPRDGVYSLLALCAEGSKIPVDYTVSDQTVLEQVLHVCTEDMCLCSTSLVAEALRISPVLSGFAVVDDVLPPVSVIYGRIDEGDRLRRSGVRVSQRTSSICIPEHPGTEFAQHISEEAAWKSDADLFGFKCPVCSCWVFTPELIAEMGGSGHVICLASLCPLTAVHIYWSSEASLLGGSEVYVINNRSYPWQVKRYPALVSKRFNGRLSAPIFTSTPVTSNVAIIISLQVLTEMCSWEGIAGHSNAPGNRGRFSMRISSLSDFATSSWRLFISHTKEALDDAVDGASRCDDIRDLRAQGLWSGNPNRCRADSS
jgi:hypothetical protein